MRRGFLRGHLYRWLSRVFAWPLVLKFQYAPSSFCVNYQSSTMGLKFPDGPTNSDFVFILGSEFLWASVVIASNKRILIGPCFVITL